MDLMRRIELENMKTEVPDFAVGDTVNVHYLIREGDKERVQIFAGQVIAIRGSGIRRSAVVRRIVAGEGVERIFPLHSPRVQAIVVKSRGRVRRAKLYYMRERVGKAVRLMANFGKTRGTRSLRRRSQDGSGPANPS
ncbi:MAG: 50S ribosomal protein L19 [Planctomycetes bacterium]|nr:50S ribosomal protein L19 [Planctomycetota bacterium]